MTGPTADQLRAARQVVLAGIVNGHAGALAELEKLPAGELLYVAAQLAIFVDRSKITLTGDELNVLSERWGEHP